MGESLLGTGGMWFMGFYLASLILVGVAGRMAKKEESLQDFYLAGRNMGLFVLFLTLYASQYSGNTFIGFAGKAYREGFLFFTSITFMIAIVAVYALYAPKLYRIGREHNLVTPGDYLQLRYGSRLLTVVVTLVAIFALANYILTNLKAIGYIVEFSTGGAVPFAWGVFGLTIIMVAYETLGGMRSVAWTDAIQGVLLFAGVLLLFFLVQVHYGGLSGSVEKLMEARPDFWNAPTGDEKRGWFSTLVVVALGIAVYPHAVQRIYAASSEKTLRRSLTIMAFMPLVTTLFMLIVGIVGAAAFPGLDKSGSERIVLHILQDLGGGSFWVHAFLVLFLSAAVAAIMSTVDSALLALSSLVTQDLYHPLRPKASQKNLTLVGKGVSWAVMGLMAWLAVILPETIWKLMVFKLELLCQIAPAIMLGLFWKELKGKAALWGVVAGLAVTLFLLLGEVLPAKPLGFHAGLWGLAANLSVLAAVQYKKGSA